jgi:hypothetical protein
MNESLDTIKRLIADCSDEDCRALKSYLRKQLPHPLELEWGIDADTILSAIRRSSDLTKRGMRGIIAEAVFVDEVCPTVERFGWASQVVDVDKDLPYDSMVKKGELTARIQVKLQRQERGTPKHYYPKHYEVGSLFVVEVQKTRSGEKIIVGNDRTRKALESKKAKTRPYAFGDFDILAVSMHPSSREWRSFRYTLGSWLLPRPEDQKLIAILQPVAAIPNEVWTDDLATCLKWFEGTQQRRVLTELRHLKIIEHKATRKLREKH